ncbi:MAG TPA: hypothetical protein VMT82_10640 [candidate division Zixibacteria bacterium]|nr:hypothetical protein [candidate division Zixibacteria bacterium]
MNSRKLRLTLALAICAAALPALSQNTQPGPESSNNTRSAPDVQVGAPSSTTPPGQPNTGGPLQQPTGQSPTPGAQTGTNGSQTGTTPMPGTGSDPTDRSTQTPDVDTNKGSSDVGTSTVKPDSTTTPDTSTTPATQNPPQDSTSPQPTPGTVPETKAPDGGNSTPQASPESSKPEPTPHTTMLPQANGTEYDPLLEPPPLPEKTLSLIGGVARKIDPVRSRLTLEPFGGGSPMRVYFDERTHFYRDGRETTMLTVHQGDRVYVDTMQLGANVFARSVRVMTHSGEARASGQIVSVDGQRVVLNDRLSGETVSFVVSPQTQMTTAPGLTNARLVPGALAQVQFLPGPKGSEAKSIQIDAVPGSSFTFQGRVTYVNIRDGVLAIENQGDGRNYELRFNPDQIAGREGLTIGAQVLAKASYNGQAFDVQNMQIVASASPQ